MCSNIFEIHDTLLFWDKKACAGLHFYVSLLPLENMFHQYFCNLLLQNVSKFLTKWLLCYARRECWKVAFNKKTMEWWWAKNLSKLLLASSASRVFFRAQLTSFNHDFFCRPVLQAKQQEECVTRDTILPKS